MVTWCSFKYWLTAGPNCRVVNPGGEAIDQKGVESSGAELVLSADQTAPNNAGADTNNAGAATNNAGVAPKNAGATTNNAGAAPNNAGETPNNAGAAPNNPGEAPNNAGAATNNAGAAPNNAGEAPNKAGAARIFPEENVKFAKLAGFPQIKSGFRLFESKEKRYSGFGSRQKFRIHEVPEYCIISYSAGTCCILKC